MLPLNISSSLTSKVGVTTAVDWSGRVSTAVHSATAPWSHNSDVTERVCQGTPRCRTAEAPAAFGEAEDLELPVAAAVGAGFERQDANVHVRAVI